MSSPGQQHPAFHPFITIQACLLQLRWPLINCDFQHCNNYALRTPDWLPFTTEKLCYDLFIIENVEAVEILWLSLIGRAHVWGVCNCWRLACSVWRARASMLLWLCHFMLFLDVGHFVCYRLSQAPPAEWVNDKRSFCGGMCFCVRKRQRAKARVGISASGKPILICSFHSKKKKKNMLKVEVGQLGEWIMLDSRHVLIWKETRQVKTGLLSIPGLSDSGHALKLCKR